MPRRRLLLFFRGEIEIISIEHFGSAAVENRNASPAVVFASKTRHNDYSESFVDNHMGARHSETVVDVGHSSMTFMEHSLPASDVSCSSSVVVVDDTRLPGSC